MLIAFDKKNNLVNTVMDKVSRGQGPFTCPACGSLVRLKKGAVMRAHFAHISKKVCQFWTENESAEHLNLKGELYRWARKTKPTNVDLEVFFPGLGQVADLLIDNHLVLEIQCSSISAERLRERTSSYKRAGFEVIWLLGKKLWLKDRLTSLQKDFLYFSANRGFHIWELDEENSELRLKYLIHEDLHGEVQYLTEVFPFGQKDLLTCLRMPFLSQKLLRFKGKLDDNICQYIAKQLHFKVVKWMAKQALAYQDGKNLLTQSPEDFYPQIQPIPFTDFAQINYNLIPYYQNFMAYYKNLSDKSVQILYSPIFYDKIKDMEDLNNGKK